MESQRLKEQVELIRQAFEYMHRFKDKTFVIKLNCTIINHRFFPVLVKDLVLLYRLGIRIVLVPGAKTRIDDILSRYDITWETVKGVRISTPEAIPFIKMAAFDVSNRIMTQLAGNNADGIIGNWVRARGIGVRNGVDFQSTGIVDKVNVEIIQNVLEDGLIPIFPNIGWNANGKPYNISSDELAYTLSHTLHADKLFFLSPCGGVKADSCRVPDSFSVSQEGIVTQMSMEEADLFLKLNKNKKDHELPALISLAYQACQKGVKRVHILDGTIEGVILKEIFSNRGSGTMIYSNQHENIRPMTHGDISEVLRIMQPYIGQNVLLERSEQDLAEQSEDFVVYEVDGLVHGCGSLHLYPGRQGEISGVAVDETYGGLGIGRRIISYLLNKAKSLKLRQVFVLTTQTTDWFQKLGFKEGDISTLPEEKRSAYDKDRKSRVLIFDPADFSAAYPL